jgi:hypothetical protein
LNYQRSLVLWWSAECVKVIRWWSVDVSEADVFEVKEGVPRAWLIPEE